jgi:phytoene synthase
VSAGVAEGLAVDGADAAGGAESLAAAYAACTRIATASGSSFRHAFRLLPSERRRALDALYAFCRVVDDAADEGGGVAAVAAWRAELADAVAGRPRHPVMRALTDAVMRFRIPVRHLEDIVIGVEMDLVQRRYATFEELRRYCYHVASAVGLATIPILGCGSPQSAAYAEALGIALQLTNVLRDVAEDAERGRIYLPCADLERFGVAERDLFTHARTDAFAALVRFECDRARGFYAAARAAVSTEDRRALATAEAMRLVYQRLLRRIAADPGAVFGPRLRVPGWEKALCTVVAWAGTRSGRA